MTDERDLSFRRARRDDLAAIIAKAMSVDKSKRYQSMEELTEALDTVTL